MHVIPPGYIATKPTGLQAISDTLIFLAATKFCVLGVTLRQTCHVYIHPMWAVPFLANISEGCHVHPYYAGSTTWPSGCLTPRVICSGGDIPTTNEIIHEVSMAKSKGIPVIACLGNNAASAGYELAGQHHWAPLNLPALSLPALSLRLPALLSINRCDQCTASTQHCMCIAHAPHATSAGS